MNEKLNCCFCNKEVDTNKNTVPPTWYGKFDGSHTMVSVTCDKCLADPKNLKNWQNK